MEANGSNRSSQILSSLKDFSQQLLRECCLEMFAEEEVLTTLFLEIFRSVVTVERKSPTMHGDSDPSVGKEMAPVKSETSTKTLQDVSEKCGDDSTSDEIKVSDKERDEGEYFPLEDVNVSQNIKENEPKVMKNTLKDGNQWEFSKRNEAGKTLTSSWLRAGQERMYSDPSDYNITLAEVLARRFTFPLAYMEKSESLVNVQEVRDFGGNAKDSTEGKVEDTETVEERLEGNKYEALGREKNEIGQKEGGRERMMRLEGKMDTQDFHELGVQDDGIYDPKENASGEGKIISQEIELDSNHESKCSSVEVMQKISEKVLPNSDTLDAYGEENRDAHNTIPDEANIWRTNGDVREQDQGKYEEDLGSLRLISIASNSDEESNKQLSTHSADSSRLHSSTGSLLAIKTSYSWRSQQRNLALKNAWGKAMLSDSQYMPINSQLSENYEEFMTKVDEDAVTLQRNIDLKDLRQRESREEEENKNEKEAQKSNEDENTGDESKDMRSEIVAARKPMEFPEKQRLQSAIHRMENVEESLCSFKVDPSAVTSASFLVRCFCMFFPCGDKDLRKKLREANKKCGRYGGDIGIDRNWYRRASEYQPCAGKERIASKESAKKLMKEMFP